MKVKLTGTEIDLDTIQFALYNIEGDLRFWSLLEPPEDVKQTITALQICKVKYLELKNRRDKTHEDISAEEDALRKDAMDLSATLRKALQRDDVNKALANGMMKNFPFG